MPARPFTTRSILRSCSSPAPARLRGPRSASACSGVAIAWQRRPLDRRRPTLAAIRRTRPRAVRDAGPREAEALIDLARGAMVTRSRDLDAFSNGDPRDVRIVDCGEGLAFACIGTRPDRRLLLESVYGYLTLKNGVPIGLRADRGAVRIRGARVQRVRHLSRCGGGQGLWPGAGHRTPAVRL